MFLVRKRLPTAFVYLYTQCVFLVVLLLLLLSVKLLSAEFAAVSELRDEKFNGPLAWVLWTGHDVLWARVFKDSACLCLLVSLVSALSEGISE